MKTNVIAVKNDGTGILEALNEAERDDLEKSIVASLADEVLVGVKSHKVRLVIKKTFEG